MKKIIFAALIMIFTGPAPAQPPMGRQYGPWDRDLEAYTSTDGRNFEYQRKWVERGGVPNLLQASEGRLFGVFQWFPMDRPEAFDQIAVIASFEDRGATWSDPEPIAIDGMPDTLHRAFDPTLVQLPDGRFRLYFASERAAEWGGRGDRAVFSAVSQDAIHFQFEPGQRFGFDDVETYDPAVVYFQGRWHLFCPGFEEGAAHHAVSEDGLTFTTLEDIHVPGSGTWIGNALQAENKIHFYGSGREGVWMAVSLDGTDWRFAGPLRLFGGDPAVVLKKDGRYLAVVTGDLREDAGSQIRR